MDMSPLASVCAVKRRGLKLGVCSYIVNKPKFMKNSKLLGLLSDKVALSFG